MMRLHIERFDVFAREFLCNAALYRGLRFTRDVPSVMMHAADACEAKSTVTAGVSVDTVLVRYLLGQLPEGIYAISLQVIENRKGSHS